jgi:hypothetical protein
MSELKKVNAETAEVKSEVKPAEVKPAEAKVEAPKKEAPKKAPRKTSTRKASTKKAAAPAAAKATKTTRATTKTAAKRTTTRKTSTRKASTPRRSAGSELIKFEFADKSYAMEDFTKIAKDVWKYDLKKKVGDLKSIELYVNAGDKKVYYVFNGDIAGSFGI